MLATQVYLKPSFCTLKLVLIVKYDDYFFFMLFCFSEQLFVVLLWIVKDGIPRFCCFFSSEGVLRRLCGFPTTSSFFLSNCPTLCLIFYVHGTLPFCGGDSGICIIIHMRYIFLRGNGRKQGMRIVLRTVKNGPYLKS